MKCCLLQQDCLCDHRNNGSTVMGYFALRRALGLLAPLAVFVAGCGSMGSYVAPQSNAAFSIHTSNSSVNTNGQVRFAATLADGAPAAVKWTISDGQNDSTIGQGMIDPTGMYTPPAALDRDSADVKVTAQLQSDTSKTASTIVQITPGFLQPLAPENAALTAGATVTVTGQIAEVSSGEVHWHLSNSARGGANLDSNYGTLTEEGCQHSAQAYTSCTVTYSAPAILPAANSSLYLVGTINQTATAAPLHILLNSGGVNSTPQVNQTAQKGVVQLGASGGNNADFDSDGNGNVLDCCGGTLGALVNDSNGTQYILSNNHVLAESDHASAGDTIVQPGLIDTACAASPSAGSGRAIASLKYYVPLASPQSNVDAALAAVTPGAVDASGAILQLGPPGADLAGASLVAAPPAGGTGEEVTSASFSSSRTFEVAKSGRTTGLTCSTIDAIHLAVQVDYFADCAETQPYYTKTFTDQIGIPGNSFSDSGDSGALVVDASNAEPVGLFFAGGTDNNGNGYSVANPIQDVLNELGTQVGLPLRIAGGAEHPVACLNFDVDEQAAPTSVPEAWTAQAESAAQTAGTSLISAANGILGAAAGRSADDPGEAAVILYVDKTHTSVAVPQTIDGLRTQVIPSDEPSVSNGSAPKAAPAFTGIHLPAEALSAAAVVAQEQSKQLMSDPAIFGVGVTQSHDNPSEAALLVLVDLQRTPRQMPAILGDMRVRYVFLHRFHVTRSKNAGAPHPSNCALRSGAAVEWKPASRIPLP
jgi:hypothetical protein